MTAYQWKPAHHPGRMPVATPRLQDLLDLRVKIDAEIEAERRRLGFKAQTEANRDAIIAVTADLYDTTPTDITSPRRDKRITEARHVAMWVIRDQLHQSYPTIGHAFGRDHTTVIYAVRRVQTSRRLMAVAQLIRAGIKGAP